MADHTTNKRAMPYPDNTTGRINVGGTDIKELAEKVDVENSGEVDFLQPGVVVSTDFEFTATMESEAEGKIQSVANTGGTAWINDATIGLMRTVTPVGSGVIRALKPGTLPASGKYMNIGIELTPTTWGGAVTVSTVSGTAKATQAEAEAAPPGISANKVRVRDVVLFNNGGSKYELKAQRDRRAWARGAFVRLVRTSGSLFSGSGLWTTMDATNLQARIECSGVPVRVTALVEHEHNAGGVHISKQGLKVDGSFIDSTETLMEVGPAETGTDPLHMGASWSYTITSLAAGSHLFTPVYQYGTLMATAQTPLVITIEELLRASANNGTS